VILATHSMETLTKKDYCVDCMEIGFIFSRHRIPGSWGFGMESSRGAVGLILLPVLIMRGKVPLWHAIVLLLLWFNVGNLPFTDKPGPDVSFMSVV